MSDEIIKSERQFDNLMKKRMEAAAAKHMNEEAMQSVQHAEVASQLIKVVNSLNIDPFIKKVMTLRIIGPLITGNERTHISIALELGASIVDVEQAEKAGLAIVNDILQKTSVPDFVEKFNRDRRADAAIRSEIDKQGNG
jgi:adenylyl- and sulfurtransferase ThiI